MTSLNQSSVGQMWKWPLSATGENWNENKCNFLRCKDDLEPKYRWLKHKKHLCKKNIKKKKLINEIVDIPASKRSPSGTSLKNLWKCSFFCRYEGLKTYKKTSINWSLNIRLTFNLQMLNIGFRIFIHFFCFQFSFMHSRNFFFIFIFTICRYDQRHASLWTRGFSTPNRFKIS